MVLGGFWIRLDVLVPRLYVFRSCTRVQKREDVKLGDIKKAPGTNPGASLVCFVVLKLGHRRPCVAKAKKEEGEKKQRVFTTPLGASQAFTREGARRLLVNACY